MAGMDPMHFLELAGVLLAAGVVSGLLAGLFGVGGGAVIVPVLFQLFGVIGVPDALRMQLAVGTSLAVIIPTSIRSFMTHRARGAVDEELLKAWALPVIGGVILGSWLASFAPSAVFKLVFVFVAWATAIKLGFGKASWTIAQDIPKEPGRSIIGVVTGLLSALMGIGGGSIVNLVMSFCNRPIHQSVATSSGVGVLISIPGAIGFMAAGWSKMGELPPLSIGYVSLIGAALIMPTSVYVAPIGARLAHRLPKRTLEIVFALFLALMGLRFLVSLI
ncbi:sulfite exporter TauE/SafE family protein [Pinisolibacter aquiterrae]|uniref:sulfite exporter TauE/SafE family protein n=1 Tax=Pinisolibacter aquiterrae TaxID=2815579 RepID=UPI001C3DDEE5|nr:sulfite exporter TauE/SafE family protein [Pinisolibacter aquiterrae]MBV5262532.1 sulfite exporter TauE/SafE family protein [Pinisolibacter aquiterrae]MCC8236984.1 sulfite exporter TauE/SafE family protein [Pinisolibacter aquiterrae]